MEGVAAAIMVVLTITLLVVGVALSKRPGRWKPFFSQRTWRRAAIWALAVTAAFVAGASVAGGDLAGTALFVGGAAFVVTLEGWAMAKTFGPE